MVVSGNEFEVVGAGAVTVVDVSGVTHSNLDSLLRDEALAICGVKLHILPEGYRFNFETRNPILDSDMTVTQVPSPQAVGS
jgi:cyanophycinase